MNATVASLPTKRSLFSPVTLTLNLQECAGPNAGAQEVQPWCRLAGRTPSLRAYKYALGSFESDFQRPKKRPVSVPLAKEPFPGDDYSILGNLKQLQALFIENLWSEFLLSCSWVGGGQPNEPGLLDDLSLEMFSSTRTNLSNKLT